ncbi:MAG TPA: peptidylprolyl isomerase, partial [Candidatus Thermoplasmatota archaeon]|nr:peptidylprolyl isomerase [Candidatus Thermoplasmatota archaeon]
SPITVCNFLRYAEEKFYEGVVWHRICTHVIQAGGEDPYTHEQRKAHPPIKNEANTSQLRNHRYTLGMARGFNESNPSDPKTVNSATSHFFVSVKDNYHLDYDGPNAPGFAVFGNVTAGHAVVADIADTAIVPDAPREAGPLYRGCQGAPAPHDQTTILRIGVGG